MNAYVCFGMSLCFILTPVKIGFCLGQHCADDGNLVFIIRVKPVQKSPIEATFRTSSLRIPWLLDSSALSL